MMCEKLNHETWAEGLKKAGVEYLPKLSRGLTAIAELIRNGNEVVGARFFAQATEGLRWMAGLLTNISLVKASEIEKFGDDLNTLLTAWENEDYVLIADLLEYEMAPFVEKANRALLSFRGKKENVIL